MHETELRFSQWVIRVRWWIIAASLILVALAGSGARHLTFTNSYRVYFGPEDPQRVAFEYLENTYIKDDSVMIVIAPDDRDVFSRETLSVVETITQQAWQLPYSSRVDSVTNFQHTEADGDDLTVADLVRNAVDLSDSELADVRAKALAEPLLKKFLVSSDAAVTAVNINVQLPGLNELEEIPSVVDAARDLVATMRAAHPDIDFHITGMTPMHNAFSEASVNDMTQIVPLSFALMFVLITFLAGGIIGSAATLMVVAFSVVAALGLSGYLGFAITPTSAPAPNIILTVAVANSVHVLISYFHELREGQDKHAAVIESLRINLHPVALASITTAIGFATMNFSEVPPFQQMGTMIAIGVLVSFVLSITFLPAVLAVLPGSTVRQRSVEDNAVKWLGDFVVRRRRSLLWGMTAVTIILVANVPRNEFNDLFFHYFDETMEFRVSTDFTLNNLTGLYTIHYSLDSGESGGISEPEFLRATHAFAQWWRAQPETEHVSSVTDTMKRLNKNMHGDDPAMYSLPQRRDLAAQYLLLYEMSLPYGLDLNNQINVDKSATRVVATLKPISITETLAITKRASDWLEKNAPDIEHNGGSGMTMMFSHLTRRNIKAMVVGSTVALVLISGLLIFALRSVKIGALSLVTNLAPIGMGFGIWAILKGEIGMSLSLVAGMTLGIVVDDTVHFLSKYLRARREQGMHPHDAVRYAFNTVGRALIVTSMVLVAGFGVLSTSHFKLNAEMGLLVAIVIVIALATVFLLLPPLLMKLEQTFGDTEREI